MSINARLVVQSTRRILACVETRGIHSGLPQNGIIRDASKKAQDLAEAAMDKVGEAGKAVKETAQAGYEKVADASSSVAEGAKDAVKSTYDSAAKQAGTTNTQSTIDACQGAQYAENKTHDVAENMKDGTKHKVQDLQDVKREYMQKKDHAKGYVAEKMEEGAEALKRDK